MIVVADASPFIGLIRIGHVDALPRFFGSIFIPPQVYAELQLKNKGPDILAFAASRADWLIIRAPDTIQNIPDLDAGESAAISLAKELNADFLLIDESRGRAAALSRDIRTLRTAAFIKQAADAGVIDDLAEAFERLKKTNFRVPHDVLDVLLQDHLKFKK